MRTSWLRRLFGFEPSVNRRESLRRPFRPRFVQLEDRLAPTVNLSIASPVPFAEGDSGAASMVFVVTRSGDTDPAMTVNYATQNGTALAGTDYTATSGTLSFAASQTTANITVPIIGNTLLQSNRTFTVALSNPLESASFAAQQTFAIGGNALVFVTVGDFNGDGRPDLAVNNYDAGTVSVRLNTTAPGAATPSFAAQQSFAAGAEPGLIALGDFNNDGRPDLVVPNYNTGGAGTVSVLLNTTLPGAATPSFAARQPFATGANPNYVAVVDLNGDGRADLAVTNASPTVSVLFNTTAPGAATPSFAAQQTIVTATQPDFVAVGDLNGDGRPDLAVANPQSDTVSVLLNTTALGAAMPSFAAQQNFATGIGPGHVAVSDLNGDGRPDLAVTNFFDDPATVSVLFNTTAPGAATPSFAAQQTIVIGTQAASVEVGDLNGDGRPDLAVADDASNTVVVLLNTTDPGAATPSFAPQQSFATGENPLTVVISDFNGDGRPDLALPNFNGGGPGTVSVLLNTLPPIAATASFAAQTTFATGTSPRSVAVADFNGDGRRDLAIANQGSTVSVLLNTTAPGATTPTFSVQQTFPTPLGLNYSVAVGDFNGDGRPDLAIARYTLSGPGTVSVLLNTTAPGAATPLFAAQQTFDAGAYSYSVAVGDFNDDGRPDVATANYDSATVSVLLNTTAPGAATPAFAAQQTFATGANPLFVAVSDFNNDGRPDLAIANYGAATVSVLLNTTAPGATTPTFSVQQTFPTPLGLTYSVAVGDLNGDGRPDLAVAKGNSDTVSVLFNTTAPGAATPSFAAQQSFAAGAFARSVTMGDLNGDGKPDLAVANDSSNTVTVLLNTTSPGAATPSFAAQQSLETGSRPFSVVMADLNFDGRLDLAIANYADGTVSVLLNTLVPLAVGSPATGTIQDDDAPTSIAIAAGNNQSANVNTAFATPLAVDVRNVNNHLVQGVGVTFVAPGSGASGTFGGTFPVLSDASGRATAPAFTANGTAGGPYVVTATAAGGSSPTVSFSLTNNGSAAPVVSAVQVNDGTAQRSRVTSLSVTFSAQVTFAGTTAAAFILTRTGGGAVNFDASATVVGGVTVVTLNNFTGAEAESGSLKDGRYTLTALAAQISAGGQQMASNYTFGDAQGLFRYYGDINGDRRVDISDFGFFSLAYFSTTNYNPAFDFNNDGRVDIADFGQFSVRYFTTLP